MDTNEKNYRHEGMSEGDPGSIDSRESGRIAPDKNVSEIEKLDIKESGLGREQGQTPADEHIDSFWQIDGETREMNHLKAEDDESMKQALDKEFDTSDFNRVDERDQSDSSADWDAEKSRTGRQK